MKCSTPVRLAPATVSSGGIEVRDRREYLRRYRAEKREFIAEGQRVRRLKKTVAQKLVVVRHRGGRCLKCPETDFRLMHLHHRDPSTKLFNVSDVTTYYNWWGKGIEATLTEADKCDVLCANCHLREHCGWTDVEMDQMMQAASVYLRDKSVRDISCKSITGARSGTAEYWRAYHLLKRVSRKIAFMQVLGGRCQCGESDLRVLHFHHRDPEQKLFAVAEALTTTSRCKWSFEELEAEVRKCDLLCANCHIRHHSSLTDDDILIVEAAADHIMKEAVR